MPRTKKNKANASLVVVGSGIKFMSQLTTETKAYIKKADKVLYLVNEPAIEEWVKEENSNTESLDSLYVKYPLRLHNYQAITKYILDTLKKGVHLCVLTYGHPAIFSQPALNAVIAARKAGYYAKVLPAISAVDCLFADLLVDPGIRGCQLIDATDLLVNKRFVDPCSHLILWQVGVIGMLGLIKDHDNTQGVNLLEKYLRKTYKKNHPVILYEAAQYPFFEPKIERLPLSELSKGKLGRITTLYIPPAKNTTFDRSVLKSLGIKMSDLK